MNSALGTGVVKRKRKQYKLTTNMAVVGRKRKIMIYELMAALKRIFLQYKNQIEPIPICFLKNRADICTPLREKE